MSLVRWTPMNSLDTMQNRWNKLFNEVFGPYDENDEMVSHIWTPRVDITEEDDKYSVVADLPGMTEKDITINLEKGILTVTGERNLTRDKKGTSYHLTERAFGKFTRSFNLQNQVNEEKIEASFKNGELKISLPKVEKVMPKKIEIKVKN